MTKPEWARALFINCPFDDAYRPLFRAACFTIIACRFRPCCSLDFRDSGSVRFEQIARMISECRYSIHDISRVELDGDSGLPRFNMPLELGADLGLRFAGPASQRKRRTLILDAVAHRYDRTLSDISGMDIEVHCNDPRQVIKHIRDWLSVNKPADVADPPGGGGVAADYETYLGLVPEIIVDLRLDPHDELPIHEARRTGSAPHRFHAWKRHPRHLMGVTV